MGGHTREQNSEHYSQLDWQDWAKLEHCDPAAKHIPIPPRSLWQTVLVVGFWLRRDKNTSAAAGRAVAVQKPVPGGGRAALALHRQAVLRERSPHPASQDGGQPHGVKLCCSQIKGPFVLSLTRTVHTCLDSTRRKRQSGHRGEPSRVSVLSWREPELGCPGGQLRWIFHSLALLLCEPLDSGFWGSKFKTLMVVWNSLCEGWPGPDCSVYISSWVASIRTSGFGPMGDCGHSPDRICKFLKRGVTSTSVLAGWSDAMNLGWHLC